MPFESVKSVQPDPPAERQIGFQISRTDQRILHESFPFITRITNTQQKRRIYKMLLSERSAEAVTLSQVKNAKELEKEARHIANFIKTGIPAKLTDAIEKIRELPSPVDFRDYIDDYEAVVKEGVYQLLFRNKIEYAIEAIEKLGEGIDFTEPIRSACFDWRKFGMNDTANKIKKAFPNIDFG